MTLPIRIRCACQKVRAAVTAITSSAVKLDTLDELIDFRRSTFEYHSQQGNKVQTIIHGVTLTAMLRGADGNTGKPLTITLPEISSKAFWSGVGKNETFHPETYLRWVKEAIERSCTIARVDVEVK